MRRLFGIIVHCPNCHSDMVAPLNGVKLHLDQPDPDQLSLVSAEMDVTDGEDVPFSVARAAQLKRELTTVL